MKIVGKTNCELNSYLILHFIDILLDFLTNLCIMLHMLLGSDPLCRKTAEVLVMFDYV